MNKLSKGQIRLLVAMIIVGILTVIACLASISTGNSFIKINAFELVYEMAKQSIEALWALSKLFASIFWNLFTQNLFFTIAIVGMIALVVMKEIFDRNER